MPESCHLAEAGLTSIPIVLQETWEAGWLNNLEWVDGHLRLKVEHREDHRFIPSHWKDVVAIAIDPCDQIYLLIRDPGRSPLWVYDPQQQTAEDFPCLLPLDTPLGLAVTDRTIFISERHRVLAISRATRQIHWLWEEPNARPADLAVGSDHLYVLDREKRRILVFDPGGRMLRQFGSGRLAHPSRMAIGGSPLKKGTVSAARCAFDVTGTGTSFTTELMAGDIVLIQGQMKRVREVMSDTLLAVDTRFDEAVPEGTSMARFVVYVLDKEGDRAKIVRFHAEGNPLLPDIVLPNDISAASMAVDQAGVLYIGDGSPLTGAEETRVIHRLFPGRSNFEPLFGYTGSALQMAFDHQGNLILVAHGGVLVRLRFINTYASRGSFLLKPIDSGDENTRWHKLLLEGDRPQETTISMRYYITNQEPILSDVEALPDAVWSFPIVNFTDTLIEGTGRFLILRGDLATNNPLITPTIQVLTAVFPRRSYLRYLPPIYQDDAASKLFLEQFLSIFETMVGRLDVQIDDTPRLIDPAAAPDEFLPWLSGWLAFGLEEGWSEAQKRAFLATAMTLYKQRGTRSGISGVVEMVTGKAPIIIESFQFRCIENTEVRQAYEQVYGQGPCHFCLLIEPHAAKKPETMTMIKRMVEEQIPAHVQAGVLGLRPWFHLGMHTYLGINTQLTRPVLRLEESVLGGEETGLTDGEAAGQVERKSRISMDSMLT